MDEETNGPAGFAVSKRLSCGCVVDGYVLAPCDQQRCSIVHRKGNLMKWHHRIGVWLCGFPSHIQVLRLREGDLLLVESERPFSQHDAIEARTLIQSKLAPGVQVLVTDPSVKLSVLRKVV